MSSSDERSRENSPNRGSRGSSRGPARVPRQEVRQNRTNLIEFVDSQDPNVKSAIQRHTAYHSAAQRREARLRSLRRGNQSRFLEWGRRPGAEAVPQTSPSSSASSLPLSPINSLQGTERLAGAQPGGVETTSPPSSELQSLATTPSRESTSSQPFVWSATEDTLVDYVRRTCQHTPHEGLYGALITFLRSDEACIQLLLAYCYAIRSRKQPSRTDADKDRQAAQQHFGQGTNILWNRLRDPNHASSDVNIQAVLMLVAYTSDFGLANEVDIHADALRTMVQQRGGIEALRNNSTLYQQLQMVDTSRADHLTLGCSPGCSRPLRFPKGFWTTTSQSPGRKKSGDDPES